MSDVPEIGTFWTVNGFIPDPNRKLTEESIKYAERYQWQGEAVTPRMAEDLAREEVREKAIEKGWDSGRVQLWVTSVFEGRVANADKYATFLDPDIMGED